MPRIKPVSLSNAPGLCKKGKKCIRLHGHEGSCWPADKTARGLVK